MTDNESASNNTIPPKAVPPVAPAQADTQEEVGGKRKTSRIPMPASSTAPLAASDSAPTISVKSLKPATQPVPPLGEAVPAPASKSKTSRIPLEAAMGIPSPEAGGGVPRTIKLKRPGDMSVSAVKSPSAATGGGPVVPPEQEPGAITQRKTIRVKRPTASELYGAEAGAANVASDSAVAAEQGVELITEQSSAAPFVALAAACILVTLGLLLVFSSEILGPNASLTQLSVAPIVNIPLPGSIASEG